MFDLPQGGLAQLAARLFEIPPFLHPNWLWLCLPVTIAVSVAWYINLRLSKQMVREFGEPALIARFSEMPTLVEKAIALVILNLLVICLVVAAAGPYEPIAPVQLPSGSVRVVMVIDASRTAAVEDLRTSNVLFGGPDCTPVRGPCGSRIDVVKEILLQQIMPSIDGNALALVTFALKGKIQSQLNYDFSPLRDMLTTLDWIRIDAGMGYSSHIEEGLKAAQRILDKTPAQPGVEDVIVLASDGGFDGLEADLAEQLKTMRDKNRKLIVLGLGNPLRSPIPLYDENGASIGQYKIDGKVVTVGRDDDFLKKKLANRIGGQYIPVTPGQPLNINWPAALSGHRIVYQNHTLHDRPLILAMVLLAVLWLHKAITGLLGKSRSRRHLQ